MLFPASKTLAAPLNKPIWWLPSAGFFLFVGFMADIYVDAQKLFIDPAAARHLASGQETLRSGHLNLQDPFTFTSNTEPLIYLEWGFEVGEAFLRSLGGLGLMALMAQLLFAYTLLFLYRTLVQTGMSIAVGFLLISLAFATLHVQFLMRPLLFTNFFLAYLIYVWRLRTVPNKQDWVVLPLLFAAWANLHPGWSAGLLFLGLSWSGRWLDRLQGRVSAEEAPLIPWLGLSALCGLAILINPYGLGLPLMVWSIRNNHSETYWDEYKMPDFHSLSALALIILLILGIVLAARVLRSPRNWPVEIFLPFLAFLYASLRSQRHTLLFVEVALVPLAYDLSALMFDGFRRLGSTPAWLLWLDRFSAQQRQAGGDFLLAGIAAVLISGLWLTSSAAQQLDPTDQVFSPALVRYLQDHATNLRRPLTSTGSGGPIMLLLYPQIKISFDDRGIMRYGEAGTLRMIGLFQAEPGWRDVVHQANYDSAILEPNFPIVDALEHEPGWSIGYNDNHFIVLLKAPDHG